jgi:gamma-glutamyltranspeptidase/glutathione hydrolase
MTMREGARIYAPDGRLLQPGEVLDQPGLVRALELVAEEGARGAYEGSIGEALLALMSERDGLVTRDDLVGYEARWAEPVEVPYAGTRFLTRSGLAPVAPVLERLPRLRELDEVERTLALFDALDPSAGAETHTTNLVAVDREGNACVLTTSLGLGSGDWLPGLDLHLNSMLGEVDLVVEPLQPGERMASMMSPSLALEREEPVLAIGSAGGTRLRTALVTVAAAILDDGLAPQKAVDKARVHRADGVANAEPGVPEAALEELESRGLTVRRWSARHHYFGGVSLVARDGAAADTRRSGAAIQLVS